MPSIRILLRLATLSLVQLLVVALAVGCSYLPTTSLRYDPVAVPNAVQPKYSVAVLPLTEARGPKQYPGLQGRLFLTYIPLLPYVKVPYERLDESYILHREKKGSPPDENQRFPVAFAREIARDLEQAGIFRQVHFAAAETDRADADLLLSGSLKSSEFDIYASSYMLGMAGVLLWLLPIPLGKNKATVSLELTLRDRAGADLWTYSSSRTASKLFTLYNSGGNSTSSEFRIEITRYGTNEIGIDGDSLWAYHAEALRAAVGDAKASLAAYLAQAK